MKKKPGTKKRSPSAGRRIIASLRDAVEWAEGKDVEFRVTTVEVPTIDVRATRKPLGLSQAAFAAKFGFQPATLKNWEQGRTRPDGPARGDRATPGCRRRRPAQSKLTHQPAEP
jgi:putative transcriptional regulator